MSGDNITFFLSRAASLQPPRVSRGRLAVRADKAVDPVAAKHASELAPTHEVMQMGKCLAQRECGLVAVEGSPEQHGHQLRRGVGIAARGDDLATTCLVVR